jgi:hypothetical protein
MSDKVNQENVDAAADRFLKEHDYDIEKVVANQVATKDFGMSRANQAFNNAFNDWKARRIAEGVPYIYKAPPEMDAAFGAAFETFRRVTKGLVGKYRAADAEAHERELGKWSERYDDLETRYHQLRGQIDEAERARENLALENVRLTAELAQTQSALGKAEAALDQAREFNNRLLANLGQGADPAADRGPVPSGGAEQAHTEPEVEPASPVRRGRGRPRKAPISPPKGSSLTPQADVRLPGHDWEQVSAAGSKGED